MATDDKKDPRRVTLKRVRLSFADSLYEKKATVEDGEPKHNCNFILETAGKEFEANKTKVLSAIRAACEEAFKGNADAWKAIAEDAPKRVCFRKGEKFKNKEGEPYQGYAGNYALSAAGPRGGKNRPVLWDRHKRPVAEQDILDVCYSGSYCDAIVSFFGTDKGGRGIFASIELIRSHQEGDRIGGSNFSAEDYKDELDDLDGDTESSGGSALDDDLL